LDGDFFLAYVHWMGERAIDSVETSADLHLRQENLRAPVFDAC